MILTTVLLMAAAASLLTFFRLRNKRIQEKERNRRLQHLAQIDGEHASFEEEKASL